MTREGSCPCGGIRFAVDGPIRDVIVCHCHACQSATGGPWPATAAYRPDLTLDDDSALIWDRAAISEHSASRGRCRSCGTVVFWDAPARDTVSFAAALLEGGEALAVAAHIWVPEEEREELLLSGLLIEFEGLPESAGVRWHDQTPGRG